MLRGLILYTKKRVRGIAEGSRLPGRSRVRRTTEIMAHDNPALDLQKPDFDEVNNIIQITINIKDYHYFVKYIRNLAEQKMLD